MRFNGFNFWWCLAFALLNMVLLADAINNDSLIFIWINGISAPIWLFFAWIEKHREALEAERGEDNKDDWSPPNGSSKR